MVISNNTIYHKLFYDRNCILFDLVRQVINIKDCRMCNEFSCGSLGSKNISYNCDKSHIFKFNCIVYSPSREKALSKIEEITQNEKVIKRRINPIDVFFETETESWKWINANFENAIRGHKPYKAYIDNDCSYSVVQNHILPNCDVCCLEGYPKFF